jgi:uncharacterized membrane protein YhaH (DUF805 family)
MKMEMMIEPLRRYADFNGRSRRQEYWLFMVFKLMIYTVIWGFLIAGIVSMGADIDKAGPGDISVLIWIGGILLVLAWLFFFIPSLAVQVRRFHDQGQSGWMALLNLPYYIPYLGTLAGIAILVFMCIDGRRGPNEYGDDPKGGGEWLGDVFR